MFSLGFITWLLETMTGEANVIGKWVEMILRVCAWVRADEWAVVCMARSYWVNCCDIFLHAKILQTTCVGCSRTGCAKTPTQKEIGKKIQMWKPAQTQNISKNQFAVHVVTIFDQCAARVSFKRHSLGDFPERRLFWPISFCAKLCLDQAHEALRVGTPGYVNLYYPPGLYFWVF